MVKEKKFKEMTLQEKCENMFKELHISQPIGEGAIAQIVKHTARNRFPMAAIAEKGLKFLTSKKKDKHSSLLLAIFCMVYSRILLDPTIGCVTVDEKKGGSNNGEKEAKEITIQ